MRKVFREEIFAEPTVQPVPGSERRTDCCKKEGWAPSLSQLRRPTGLVRNRKRTLTPNSTDIGQTSGRKLDGEVVATERRDVLKDLTVLEHCRIFNVAEFLSPQHISSYFSRLAAAKVREQLPDDCDVQASEARKSNSRWQGIWP